jgi:hypothetical protein
MSEKDYSRFTTEQTLDHHLVEIMKPAGSKVNAKYAKILVGMSDRAQRMAACDRARSRAPFLRPSEESEALVWVGR